MKKEEFIEINEILLEALKKIKDYLIELEERIEKLEAKDFTRNEPLIGDY